MSPNTVSGLVKEFKLALNDLGQPNPIILVWTPGHSDVEGYEAADKLARLDSLSKYLTAQTHIPIPHAACRNVINDWVVAKHARWWNTYSGGVHTKRFFPKPCQRWSKDLLLLERKKIRTVVGAIKSYYVLKILKILKKYLTTIGLSLDPKSSCCLEDETGLHVICECPMLSNLRRRTLGEYFIDRSEILKIGPITLYRLLVETNKFV